MIWAIESVCYVKDKSEFLKEAFRILKKGGRLIVIDIFRKQEMESKDAGQIQRLSHGWAIEEHSTWERFEEELTEEGFSNIQTEDASHAIMRSVKRLYRAYFMGIIPSRIYRLFHPKVTALAKNNVDTAYLQYKTLKKHLWKYLIVSAERE